MCDFLAVLMGFLGSGVKIKKCNTAQNILLLIIEKYVTLTFIFRDAKKNDCNKLLCKKKNQAVVGLPNNAFRQSS